MTFPRMIITTLATGKCDWMNVRCIGVNENIQISNKISKISETPHYKTADILGTQGRHFWSTALQEITKIK